MLEIPITTKISSDFTFNVLLDRVTVRMRIKWNDKTQFWMVNTYEEPDNDLVFNGLKIIPNYPFLYTYNPSFSGEIICLKVGNDTKDEITYTNFGIGWRLFYMTSDEFSDWRLLSGF